MYLRIIGDTGSTVIELAEHIVVGSGLLKLYAFNRKFTGSTIGYCLSDNRAAAVF